MGIKDWNVQPDWTLFLDRDGVINRRIFGGYVLDSKDFIFEKGVISALQIASRSFKHIVVVTNQQCVGLELLTEEELAAIHANMLHELEEKGGRIDAVFAAINLKSDSHNRRKPNSDMALEAKLQFPDIDFSKSIMVGDTDSDIAFGKNLGMKTVLVKSEESVKNVPDLHVNSLEELMRLL